MEGRSFGVPFLLRRFRLKFFVDRDERSDAFHAIFITELFGATYNRPPSTERLSSIRKV